jgi:hypothetical protein
MKFLNFKPYAKCGLFLIFIISLVGTAYADANQLVHYDWSNDTGSASFSNSGYENVSTNYGNTTVIPSTGQTVRQSNEQDSANTIIDNSGHGNNGVNYGSKAFILPTGQTARHFNEQNRVTIPTNAQLAFTDPHITFGVFFRCNNSNQTYTYLVSRGNNTLSISIDHMNSTITYKICAGGHEIYGQSESNIQLDKDYEAIVTYDGSHAQLYINGVADGNGVNYAAALDPVYSTDNWTIGSSNNTIDGLNGTIYDFYLYKGTLDSSEILNLYGSDLHSIEKLRSGGIALSWDDSAHIDPCYQYLPLFQKYNATCTMNVNNVINRPPAIIDELNALHKAGWEISSHGYNHIDTRIFIETDGNTPSGWLKQEIVPSINEVAHYNYPVRSFIYPYSSRDATTDAIVSPYFRTLRTIVPDVINGNVNQTPKAYYNWDDTKLLYGVEIDDQTNVSLESIENGIDYAIKTGSVLVLYGQLH